MNENNYEDINRELDTEFAKAIAELVKQLQGNALDVSDAVDQILRLAPCGAWDEFEKQILASDLPKEEQARLLKVAQEAKLKAIHDAGDEVIRQRKAKREESTTHLNTVCAVLICATFLYIAIRHPDELLGLVGKAARAA